MGVFSHVFDKKVYHNQMIIIEQHALYRVWTPLNTYAEFLLLYIKKNPWNSKGLRVIGQNVLVVSPNERDIPMMYEARSKRQHLPN